MRSHVRTVVVLALAVGLLALFLHNVDLWRVGAEIVRARPEWLALVAGDDVRESRDSSAALAVPAGTARSTRVSRTRFARRPSASRRAACCRRAPARSFARISWRVSGSGRTVGADDRDRRLCDDHPRAAARLADRARAAGVVRVRVRPRSRQRSIRRLFAVVEVGRRDAPRRCRCRRWSCCSCSPDDPERLGRAMTRLERVAAVDARGSGRADRREVRARPRRDPPAESRCSSRWRGRFRCGCRSAAGIWAVAVAFRLRHAVHRIVSAASRCSSLGVAVPTPGAIGGFHEAFRVGATTFFGAPNDAAVGAAIVLHAFSIGPVAAARPVLRGPGRPERRAACGALADSARQEPGHDRMKCPYCAHLGDKVVDSRESEGRRGHPPPARVPRVRQAVHQLRADRRDPVHGGQEGRHAASGSSARS